jgi:FkbM family methyltransferase
VIVGDWTAMTEVCGAGWLIEKEHARQEWTALETYWWVPDPKAIYDAMELAYHAKGGKLADELRSQALKFTKGYRADYVASYYWKPALSFIEMKIHAERVALAGPTTDVQSSHTWSRTGLYGLHGEIYFPSTDPESDLALVKWPDGRIETATGWGYTTTDGVTLDLEDDPEGGVAKIIIREITQSYGLHTLDLEPDDLVVDLGGHIGAVSCYLARKYDCRIITVEPHPDNLKRLRANLRANNVEDNVTVLSTAVTRDGRDVSISGDPRLNSGGHSVYTKGKRTEEVPSLVLSSILSGHGEIAVLKVDIEGAEYEVLMSTPPDILKQIHTVVMELHTKPGSTAKPNEDAEDLINYLLQYVYEVRIGGISYRASAESGETV